VVVDDNPLDGVLVGLVDFGNLVEEVDDDFDVLKLFAGLYLPVKGEAVVVGEDGLGVLGHHDHPHFLLDELEVELGSTQVPEVVLVPLQLEQPSNKLELEQEVDVGIVAPVYQPLHHPLNSFPPSFLEDAAGPSQHHQVHVKGKLQSWDVSLLF